MTDTRTLAREKPDHTPDPTPPEPKPRLLDLSATQLIAGALSAMTAAVIGARIGVAGTVLGAAVGSIVAGIAGTLYTASLKHTKEKITSAFVGRIGDTRVEVAEISDTTASRVPAAGLTEDTVQTPGWDRNWDSTVVRPAVAAPVSAEPVARSAEVAPTSRSGWRLPWKGILVSTAAVFLLAIGGITGFELISGHAVSGGQGTTITQVSDGRSGGSDSPSEAPSSDSSADPSTEPSAQPSDDETSEPSTEPSTGPTESSEPSTGTSQTPVPSASGQPTTTTGPTSSAGGQGTEANSEAGGDLNGG